MGLPWKKEVLRISPGQKFPEDGQLIAVNGTTPGPVIRLKRGDFFHATVQNTLPVPTSVHWHGLIVPNLMDGVPDVTQAAIPPDRSLTYQFPIVQGGTYWYHSHVGFQEQQGLSGPLVIEDPEDGIECDAEAILFLEDRLTVNPDEVFAALQGKPAPEAAKKAATMAMGMAVFPGADGKPVETDVFYDRFPINGREAGDPFVIEAEPGQVLRLRVINGGASTYFRFAIEGQTLRVVLKDGNAVVPTECDGILIAMAERYDVLIKVPEKGVYRITGDAVGQTSGALAILRAGGAAMPDKFDPPKPGAPATGRTIVASDLRATKNTTLPEGAERRIPIELGGDMKAYRWSINGEYYPDAQPLIVAAGERVLLEMHNRTMMPHPMHLHGHFFRVLKPGTDARDAPLMDTVSIDPNDSLTLEFFTDNPGAWAFHCHNLYHMVAGMFRVIAYEA